MIVSGLLPSHVLDHILLRLELKSLALLRCTNRALRSYISHPNFEADYFSRFGSYLLQRNGFDFVFRHSLVSNSSSSTGTKVYLPNRCRILASRSGLVLLLLVNTKKLCVANPITKRFWILDPFAEIDMEKKHCIGFKIELTAHKFKIVLIRSVETTSPNESMYQFVVHSGESWITSKRTITCCSSDLTKRVRPVYFEGSLHWLRDDGSIIAFNPDTEQARLIPSVFHKEPDTKLFFTADEKINHRLTLISTKEEEVAVYTLDLENEWSLTSLFKNVWLEKSKFLCWNVAAFDGKCVVVTESKEEGADGVVHEYDMRANRWRVLGSTPWSMDVDQDLYHFMPSWSSVIKLENPPETKKLMAKLRPVPLCTRTESIQAFRELVSSQKFVRALSKFLDNLISTV